MSNLFNEKALTFNTVSRFFGSLFSSTKNSNVKTPSNPVTRDSADSSPISKGLKEVAKQAPQTIKQNSSGSEPNYSESDSENQSLDEHPAGPSHSMDSSSGSKSEEYSTASRSDSESQSQNEPPVDTRVTGFSHYMDSSSGSESEEYSTASRSDGSETPKVSFNYGSSSEESGQAKSASGKGKKPTISFDYGKGAKSEEGAAAAKQKTDTTDTLFTARSALGSGSFKDVQSGRLKEEGGLLPGSKFDPEGRKGTARNLAYITFRGDTKSDRKEIKREVAMLQEIDSTITEQSKHLFPRNYVVNRKEIVVKQVRGEIKDFMKGLRTQNVQLSAVVPGNKLASDIVVKNDKGKTITLGAGRSLTDRDIDLLKQNGIKQIKIMKEISPQEQQRETAAVLLGVCDGVMHLHQNGIVHNDIAQRNILVDESKDLIAPDANAIGKELAIAVIIEGNTIVEAGKILDADDIKKLNDSGAGKIKVLSGKKRGMLTDFGLSTHMFKTMKVDTSLRGQKLESDLVINGKVVIKANQPLRSKDIKLLQGYGITEIKVTVDENPGKIPPDVAAPEIKAGFTRSFDYSYLTSEDCKPGIKSDAFSTAVVIRNLFVRDPTVDSDLRGNSDYIDTALKEATEMKKKFDRLVDDDFPGNPSALSEPEFRAIQDIDEELGTAVKSLMSFDPRTRPDLTAVRAILSRISTEGGRPIQR